MLTGGGRKEACGERARRQTRSNWTRFTRRELEAASDRWRDERLGSTEPMFAAAAMPADAASPAAPGGALAFAAPIAPLRPPPGVAEPGRRLTRSVSRAAVVAFVVIVVFWVWRFVSGALTSLSP